MDISMNETFASVVRYIQQIKPDCQLYFMDLPERMRVPCIYFPTQNVETEKIALNTYQITTDVECQCFAMSDWLAMDMARSVILAILADEGIIPVVDKTGKCTGQKIKISNPKYEKQEENVYQISFQMREYMNVASEKIPMETVTTDASVKLMGGLEWQLEEK